MFKYAAVVVLYNPDDDVFENFKSYLKDVGKLYIIDNSDCIEKSLIEKIEQEDKCVYKKLGGNKGLAYALNIGCNIAIKDGFEYALTMDQDSRFAKNAVMQIIDFIENSEEHYAIVCPNVKSLYFDTKTKEEKIAYTSISELKNELKNWVMTSGSMMNLKDFDEVNGFDDQMFIAHVDIDLGIKFQLKNKKIIMLGKPIIYQRFGNSRPKHILWKTVHPSFASPVRTYYLFRNQKYLEMKYGKEVKKYINVYLYKFIIKIILFEEQKLQKIKMAVSGLRDGKKSKMGLYIEK